MKAVCPKDPEHKKFITTAHISEDWIVDEHGNFLEHPANPDAQVTHGPDSRNNWSCAVCGAAAKVEEE